MSEDNGWGQLVSLTDFESEPITFRTNTFAIGRAPDCELSLSDNKLVSGHHCHIERDTDGAVTLQDTSTNGTLLNMKKLSKGQRKLLRHGDEIYIVYKESNKELNVGYIYQDVEELMNEEGTQEYSPPTEVLDATLEDSECNDYSPVKIIPTSSNKRKSTDDESENESCAKKSKVDACEEKNITEKEPKDGESEEKVSAVDQKSETGMVSETGKVDECKKEVTSKAADDTRDDIEENLQCMICHEIMHDCISLQPCLHSFCAGCYSDWMSRSQDCPSCRNKVERINKNHIVNNLIEAYLKEHPGKKRPSEDIEELNNKNKITHDMLYPKEKIQHDDSSDYGDTDDDDNNDDELPVVAAPRPFMGFLPPPPQVQAPMLFGFGTPIFGGTAAYKTVCRQCPEYKEPEKNGAGVISGIKNVLNTVKNIITGEDTSTDATAASDEAGEPACAGPDTDKPSTSGENVNTGEPGSAGDDKPVFKDDPKEMPIAPNHVCGVQQNHVLCQCCLQPMPDHRVTTNLPVAHRRPQQCGVCYRAFCHPYWGCRKADCLGCLNKFKEMNFGRKCLAGLILDNQFESEIFKDYIDSKGLSVKDVLQECCRQMETGRFSVTAQGTHRLTTETPVCYGCGLNSFKQLAFQYRKTLKQEDLPDKALNRADCYWGSKCRTQRNKPHHARNFNHICDQTRQF